MDRLDIQKSVGEDGIFFQNPSHLHLIDRAIEQSDIVEAIRSSRRSRKHERFEYTPENSSKFMPGTIKLREMDRDQIEQYFHNLFRIRPNIFVLRVTLGDYPDIQEITDRRVSVIGSTRSREHKLIAKDIADLFDRFQVVDFLYYIENAEPGKFSSRAKAWQTSKANYKNKEYFNPIIELEYIPITGE